MALEDDRAFLSDLLRDRGAVSVDGWTQATPDEDIAPLTETLLTQWNNEDGSVSMIITRNEFTSDRTGKTSITFRARLRGPAVTARQIRSRSVEIQPDDSATGSDIREEMEEAIEDTVDGALDWMDARDPNRPPPNVRFRMQGGLFIPLINAARRFGGSALIEADTHGVEIAASAFNSAVELDLPASDMESYDLRAAGAAAFSISDLWDAIKDFNFGDVITVEATPDDDRRPRLQTTGGGRIRMENAAGFRELLIPDPDPVDARFSLLGRDYTTVIRAGRPIATTMSEPVAAFGVLEGVPVFILESDEEAIRARFDVIEVRGDALVAVLFSRLDELTKQNVIPRPASTEVTFTIAREVPLLAEWAVNGSDARVRIALSDPEAIEDFELRVPIEEVTVPEPEAEPEAEPMAAEGPPPGELTPGQVETIVEEATAGISVETDVVDGRVRRIRLIPDFDVEFIRPGADERTIETPLFDRDLERSITTTLEQWGLMTVAVPDDVKREINTRREALSDQFDLDLPLLDVEPAEAEAPTAAGFTADELERAIGDSIVGASVDVTVNPTADSLRITFDVPTVPTVDFERDLDGETIAGTASDPVQAVNEALALWEDAVNLRSISDDDRDGLIRSRESLEDAFDIDLLELGDAPPEAAAEPGEGPEITPEGVWATVREIGLDQAIPKEDREHRIGELLEGKLVDAYPEEFEDLIVGLDFQQGAGGGEAVEDILLLHIGGELSPAGKNRFVRFPSLSLLEAMGSIKDPEAVWEEFLDIVAMFDPETPGFSEVTDKLETVAAVSAFRIEEGIVDFDDIFLPPPIVRQIVRRNRDLYTLKILGYMEDTSAAWHAGQRVQECAQGVQAICDLIEREIAGRNPRGWTEWYLKQAYTIYLEEGTFDPGAFVRDWHDVFRPGESEREARDRRGVVDLETLGRAESPPARDNGIEEPPEDDDAAEVTDSVEQPAEEGSIEEFRAKIRDRLNGR